LNSLRREGRAERLPRRVVWGWLGAAAAVALVAVTAWSLVRVWSLPSAQDQVARDVVSDHVRSLLAGPLLQVESTSQHTVKPWFNKKKVDFSPTVKDLTQQGFVLKGGRQDYVDGKLVAVIVYQ